MIDVQPAERTGGMPRSGGERSLLFLFLLLLPSLISSPEGRSQESGDTTDVWEDVEESEGDFAEAPGGFGIYGGPSFELSSLKTTSLDPALDYLVFLKGGYGYILLAHWLIGGGGAGQEVTEPNDRYDRFSIGFGGFLTGYQTGISDGLSGRLSLLVGGGSIEMIRKRPDLSTFGSNEFLERYRAEDFFLLRPELSIGYELFRFLDIRLVGSYLYPVGGGKVADLRQFTGGIHFMFGFQNNIY